MKTVLICHEEAQLDRVVLARWMASFSDLTGIVVLREPRARFWRRVRREIQRTGFFRFLDVLAFRVYYRLRLRARDEAWEREKVAELSKKYPELDAKTAVCLTPSPNSPEAEEFLQQQQPDFVIARCKAILKPAVFSIPRDGVFVMHPGICPEYRNAHGCFWALAQRDYEKVGMTLLRIDAGVDTGPVYGYYSYAYDAANESHVVMQKCVVLENLDALREKLIAIHEKRATPIDTSGRSSRAWGQPWLSSYWRILAEAQRR
jgi:folate-dependent phosphoribosylglycinamide formyltransferase PurN